MEHKTLFFYTEVSIFPYHYWENKPVTLQELFCLLIRGINLFYQIFIYMCINDGVKDWKHFGMRNYLFVQEQIM